MAGYRYAASRIIIEMAPQALWVMAGATICTGSVTYRPGRPWDRPSG
jgi:hypothetical protein